MGMFPLGAGTIPDQPKSLKREGDDSHESGNSGLFVIHSLFDTVKTL
jgi:hypothetical protein